MAKKASLNASAYLEIRAMPNAVRVDNPEANLPAEHVIIVHL
jgi:hypothetical protein